MAKQNKRTSRNILVAYTTDPEDARAHPGLKLISMGDFNDVANYLSSNSHATDVLPKYRKVGPNKYELVSSSYRYKGCKIRVQEPVFWNANDDPCISIVPQKGCDLGGLLMEIGLKPIKPEDSSNPTKTASKKKK